MAVTDPDRPQLLKNAWPLLVAPALFLLLHTLFSQARGPFYLALNYDPDYAYLFNGLNLASGIAPAHVDHPGITLQLFAAAYMKLTNIGSATHAVAVTVLTHSESYLKGLNWVLMFFCCSCLLLVGLVVWRKTGSLTASLLLQATPFLVAEDFVEIVRFRPELMILIVVLIMAAVLYIQVLRDSPGRGTLAIGLLSFLAATGAATKLNFLPLVLLPLFGLRTWRDRASYSALGCFFAVLWLLPLKQHYARFAGWVMALLTREGRYGIGDPGLVSDQYPTFLAQLIVARPLFFLMMGLSVAAIIYVWRRETKSQQEVRLARLLAGLVLVQAVEYLMVGKYGHPRYLFPALAFCGLNAALLLALIRHWHDGRTNVYRLQWVCLSLGILIACWSGLKLRHLYVEMAKSRDLHAEMAQSLERDVTGKTLVYYFGCSSRYHALWFGNAYSGRRYGRIIIDDIFPNHPPAYFVEECPWPNKTFWYSVAGPDELLEDRLKRGEILFLAGQEWPKNQESQYFVFLPKDIPVSIDTIRRCGDEAFYRIKALSSAPTASPAR